jgi:hypothetical protein
MTVVMAGFVDFHITQRVDVFTGAPHEGSAVNYGTQGITFGARRPHSTEEWHAALQALNCEIPED